MGLKKAVDLAPLFMDNNGCHRTLLIQNNSSSGVKEYSSKFTSNHSATGFSKDRMIMSMSEEDGGVRENGPQNKTHHSTYVNGDSCLTQRNPSTGDSEERQTSVGTAAAVNRLNRTSQDSCLSDRSSVDSFTGLTSPQDSVDSVSASPDGLEESEPIYAESTKRKLRPPEDGKSRPEVSENQRATITVMAAHTEENNLTFYLRSPDSAVSTQWTHFSPKDPSVPAFTWPDASGPTPSPQPKPQSSPPVPPKINTRSPRLGTSSLTPLPELSFHVSPKDITCAPLQGDGQSERRSLSVRSLEARIDEVDEEHEHEEGTARRTESDLNESAVCESRSRESSEGRTTPGTTNNNKSSSQTQELRAVSSSSLLEVNAERTAGPEPPPPPPKKHHR